jgi:hypothetical protein
MTGCYKIKCTACTSSGPGSRACRPGLVSVQRKPIPIVPVEKKRKSCFTGSRPSVCNVQRHVVPNLEPKNNCGNVIGNGSSNESSKRCTYITRSLCSSQKETEEEIIIEAKPKKRCSTTKRLCDIQKSGDANGYTQETNGVIISKKKCSTTKRFCNIIKEPFEEIQSFKKIKCSIGKRAICNTIKQPFEEPVPTPKKCCTFVSCGCTLAPYTAI